MPVRGMFRPGMRAYIIPMVAGVVLVVSAFLPWIVVGEVRLRAVPDTLGTQAGIWIFGLGAAAVTLATLSLITRKNSRHPLLLVGLVALGIMVLSWRIFPETIADRALTRSQAIAIVDGGPVVEAPTAQVGSGIYVGLLAAVAIVGFGLTIVVKRASHAYVVVDPDDDV